MVNNKALKKQCRKILALCCTKTRTRSGTYCYQKVQPRSQSSLHLEKEPENKVAEGEKKKNGLLFMSTFCHVLMGIPFEKKKHAQTYLVLCIELPVHVVFLKNCCDR